MIEMIEEVPFGTSGQNIKPETLAIVKMFRKFTGINTGSGFIGANKIHTH